MPVNDVGKDMRKAPMCSGMQPERLDLPKMISRPVNGRGIENEERNSIANVEGMSTILRGQLVDSRDLLVRSRR